MQLAAVGFTLVTILFLYIYTHKNLTVKYFREETKNKKNIFTMLV